MGRHCPPIVGEDIFQTGPPARLLRQQQSHCRTHRGQLAPGGVCLLPPFLGSTKEVLQGLPLPPLHPHPLLLLLLLLHCSLWSACLQLLHPRVKLVPLLLRGLRRILGLLRLLLCILQLPLQLQNLPLRRHSPLLPLGLGLL